MKSNPPPVIPIGKIIAEALRRQKEALVAEVLPSLREAEECRKTISGIAAFFELDPADLCRKTPAQLHLILDQRFAAIARDDDRSQPD